MQIEVDVAAIIRAAEQGGDAGPDVVTAYLLVILRHEYQHTPDYGTPTPGPGGYSNGPCAHMDVARDDLDFLCELIATTTDPVARAALCWIDNSLVGAFNGALVARNKLCPGVWNRRFLCPGC